MTTRRFRVTALVKAELDVEKIFVWLRKRSPKGAASWLRSYEQATSRLESIALTCPRSIEAIRMNLPVHELLFKTRQGKRYRLLFVIEEDEVLILRVRGPGQRSIRRRDLGL